MTPLILGIVTDTRGVWVCAKCGAAIEMVAVLDRRSVRSRLWRECGEPHVCVPTNQPTGTITYPGMPR